MVATSNVCGIEPAKCSKFAENEKWCSHNPLQGPEKGFFPRLRDSPPAPRGKSQKLGKCSFPVPVVR